LQRLVELAGTVPGFALYLAVLAVLSALAAWDIIRGNGSRAFVWVVAILLASLTFRFGDDTGHHVYRIAVLAEQIRTGAPGLLVGNTAAGETLPVFVYYSFVPYLPGVALDLSGFGAHVSYRLVMGLALVVLALGLVRLIRIACDRDANAAFLAAILFLCANYVFSLWLVRQAYAEIWVYCLIPWVTLMMVRPGALAPLAALLFLQMSGHPIVFAQAFACSLLIAWALSGESPSSILRRYAGATAVALAFAAPFWLPQVMWQSLIQGPTALPIRFADTFLSFGEVVGWQSLHGLGFALPVALVLALALARARLSGRAWMLVAALLAVLAIQTEPLRPLAERLPLLPTSLFVWRLMFPAALLAFALLVVTWQPRRRRDAVLAAATLASLAGLGLTLVAHAPDGLERFADRPADDAAWIRSYESGERVWGRSEFLPNYRALPQRCAPAQPASFADLQRGVPAPAAYVAVRNAPLAGLTYTVDGTTTAPAACGEDLVLGPLQPGATLRVSGTALTAVLYARIAALALGALGCLWFMLRGGRTVRRQAA
jgi:hypothetical protein